MAPAVAPSDRLRRGVRRLVRVVRFAGRGVECPCCGGRFSRFATGDFPTAVACPRCQSRPRHRLLWLYLRDCFPIGEVGALLHCAPEQALRERLASLVPEYVSVDVDDSRSPTVVADITRLPFPDASFDLVLCSHVLKHVIDDRRAMAELRRVLRPAGTALVQSPVNYSMNGTFEVPGVTSPQERLRLFSQSDHVRVYGPDLKDRLESVGFSVAIECYADKLDHRAVERFGLVPRVEPLRNDIYRCER